MSKEKCQLCRDIGWIGIEVHKKDYPFPTEFYRRCYCQAGERLNKAVKQLNHDELREYNRKYNGILVKKGTKYSEPIVQEKIGDLISKIFKPIT